jgi:hypothetical protein
MVRDVRWDVGGVSKKFGEWYQKTNKTEDTNKLTLLALMAPPYSPDLAPADATSGEYGGLISVSPPEEHHERLTFCRRGGHPRTCDSGYAIDS